MDHSHNVLGALQKALTDTVAPSLDRTDPLASEQLPLVTEYLEFLEHRIYRIHERSRLELTEFTRVAEGALSMVEGWSAPAWADLEACSRDARDVLTAPEAGTERIMDQTARLSTAITAALREHSGPADERRALARWVVEASRHLLRFQRVWYAPLGFESSRGEIGDIDDYLGVA